MNGFNVVTLRGEFINGPQVEETRNGFKLVEMNLAVTEPVMQDGKWGKRDTVIPVTFFGDTAEELRDRYHAGDLVIVTGKVRSTAAQTQNGREYYRLTISGTDVEQIFSPYEDRAAQRASAAAPPQQNYQPQTMNPPVQQAPQGFQQRYNVQQGPQDPNDCPF